MRLSLVVQRPTLERGEDASSLAQQLTQLAPFAHLCSIELSKLLRQPGDTAEVQHAVRAVTQLMVNSLAAVQQTARQLGEHVTAARLEHELVAALPEEDCDREATELYMSTVIAAQRRIR